jgi:hypothetical protein
MTAPLQQPTGDRHQIGGVERRKRPSGVWYAVAHGHLLASVAGLWVQHMEPAARTRHCSSPAHAMRNALRWARAHPVTHRPAGRRARAEFARLVGA